VSSSKQRNKESYQIRRAAVSVPSNIAESAARRSKKEFIQFLYMALGSLSELETQIIIVNRLEYLNNLDILLEDLKFVEKLINGLIYYLKK
jgi:four helix bundle protein